jgi:hypothetical protein
LIDIIVINSYGLKLMVPSESAPKELSKLMVPSESAPKELSYGAIRTHQFTSTGADLNQNVAKFLWLTGVYSDEGETPVPNLRKTVL